MIDILIIEHDAATEQFLVSALRQPGLAAVAGTACTGRCVRPAIAPLTG